MLVIGYCFGIRPERRLCEDVHLNLAYRWFCRLQLDQGCGMPVARGSIEAVGVLGVLFTPAQSLALNR